MNKTDIIEVTENNVAKEDQVVGFYVCPDRQEVCETDCIGSTSLFTVNH